MLGMVPFNIQLLVATFANISFLLGKCPIVNDGLDRTPRGITVKLKIV